MCLDHDSANSLDALAGAWLSGDERAEARLFEFLRVRFLAVAKRRVQPDHLEDLVQEALQIVLRKGREQRRSENVLTWSLTILRNVIGNHYQARKREQERMATGENILENMADPAIAPDRLDEIDPALEQALRELAEGFPRCGRIFAAILRSLEQGGGPREVSQRALARVQGQIPDLTRGSFYTALHRCRSQLRVLLEKEPRHA